MAYACHMDSDLVSSPGFQPAFDVIILVVQMGDHPVVGDGPFSSGLIDGDFFTVFCTAGKGSVDGSLFRFQVMIYDRLILSRDAL